MKLFLGKKTHIFGLLVPFLLISLWFGGCSYGITEHTAMDTAMGTIVKMTVYTKRQSLQNGMADQAGKELTKELRRLVVDLEQQELSRKIETSLIGQLNREGKLAVETRLYEELLLLKQVAEQSGGALDLTLGEVTGLWDLDRAAADASLFQLPKEEALKRALEKTGTEKMVFSEDAVTLKDGVQLDLGAVGKGIACDRLLEKLKEKTEVTGAVIALGGSILTYGSKPDQSPFHIGILDPRDPASYLGFLSLKGQWCVATSGDYERFVEVDGMRYHHILDPATGYPAASGLCSVTILGKNGTLCDGLSTACFVLGAEEGMKLLEAYEVFGLFVTEEGEILLSPGAEAYFTPQF